MSKRRNAGDIVKKAWGAGFVGEELLIKLLPEEVELLGKDGKMHYIGHEPCVLYSDNPEFNGCGKTAGIPPDAKCVEWSNCEVVGKWDANENLIPIADGHCVYHVSECQMVDYEPNA